jgi:hypothetical protein
VFANIVDAGGDDEIEVSSPAIAMSSLAIGEGRSLWR